MRAKQPLIALETYEEIRARDMITSMFADGTRKVFVWTVTSGSAETAWTSAGGCARVDPAWKAQMSDPLSTLAQIDDADTTGNKPGHVYILHDFHKFLEGSNPNSAKLQRKLRDLVPELTNKKKTIIFVSPQFPIPGDLQKSMAIIDMPLPDKKDLENILCGAINGLKSQEQEIKDRVKDNADDADKVKALKTQLSQLQAIKKRLTDQALTDKDQLISAGLGLTAEEYENTISKCMIRHDLTVQTILSEKRQIIKKTGVLEYFDTAESSASIGGLAILKKWIKSASKRFSPKAAEYGIDQPRGVLMVGAPGTGKSLTAKAISNELRQPLLRLDMASMSSKWYGETGNNMKIALKTAHAVNPCILWIDEIEKAFASGQGGMEMHEESARTLGALLTDMEESTGIFYVATSNSPFALKPELMARFPKTFFVDLPSNTEREEIFSIHIRKVRRDPAKFNLPALIDASAGYSGREIRNVIQEGLALAFDADKEITTDHILDVLARTVPISKQKADEIDRMRKWALQNATNASETAPAAKTDAPARTRELDLLSM